VQVRKRKQELSEIEGQMFEEVKRADIIMQNDIREMKNHLESLRSAQRIAELQLHEDNETLVQLRELEYNAETVRSLYSNFLRRYKTSLQDQSYPVSNAQVLNPARIPGIPSAPNKTKMVTAMSLKGFSVMCLLTLIAYILDNKIRTEEQINHIIKLSYIGGLSRIKVSKDNNFSDGKSGRVNGEEFLTPDIMYFGADNPSSSYAEALRNGKINISIKSGGGKKVVG